MSDFRYSQIMGKVIVELKVKEEFLEMLNFLLDKTESIELFHFP